MREMRFHGEWKIDFRLYAVNPSPSSTVFLQLLGRSALISQEFLCDGEIENNGRDVAKHAGNEIPFSGCKLF